MSKELGDDCLAEMATICAVEGNLVGIDTLDDLRTCVLKHAAPARVERPTGNNADEWALWFFEHAGHGAQYLGVQIAEAIDEQVMSLRRALEDVLDPMAYLSRCAARDGSTLNASAPQIAESSALLRDIARSALAHPTRSGT